MAKKNLRWTSKDLENKPGIKSVNLQTVKGDFVKTGNRVEFKESPTGRFNAIITGPITWLIDPMPAPRLTKKMVNLAKVPDHKLSADKKKIKERVVNYQNYKLALNTLASSAKFILPQSNFHVVFYVKTKDKKRWGEPMKKRPDLDNYMKAFKDALTPVDSYVWDYRITKLWASEGKITIKPLADSGLYVTGIDPY